MHKQQVDERTATVLGWEIDGPGRQVRPKKERVWRIRLAIRGLLRRGRVSSADMERLLGHMCFVSSIRRESLSVLDSCYKFVVKTRHVKREMQIWDSVANELRPWDGLAPLLWARFDAPACPTVVMVDASGWGLGAARASAPEALVTSVARTSERWRFRASEKQPPREQSLKTAMQCVVEEKDTRDVLEALLGRQVDEEPRHVPPLPAPSSDPFDRRKPPAWNDVPGELLDRDWVVCGRKK